MGNTFWTDGAPAVGTALNQTNLRKVVMGEGIAQSGNLALGGATGLNWDDTNKRLGLGTDTPAQQLHLTSSLLLSGSGNLLLGSVTPGTSLAKGLAWASGTAPSGSHPSDAVQCWVADRNATAGKASLHLRTEDGTSHVLGDRVGIGTLTPSVALEVTGACMVTGHFACNGQTPASQPTYTASNVTVARSYDANSTTLDELADVVGTLLADFRSIGLVL